MHEVTRMSHADAIKSESNDEGDSDHGAVQIAREIAGGIDAVQCNWCCRAQMTWPNDMMVK
jgi:hypothetical protein